LVEDYRMGYISCERELEQCLGAYYVLYGCHLCTRQSSRDDDVGKLFMWRSREIPEEIDGWLLSFV
jgi:hypothetical protein